MNLNKKETLNLMKIIGIAIFSTFVFNACAKIVSPTGGDKDEQAPSVLSSSAQFPATNFSDHEITFVFDEFIDVQNVANIKISPRVENPVEVKVRGKKLIVILPDELNDNLTYTINFDDAIKDFNEKNTIESFSLVFTAKEKIDSASIKGRVINAFDHKFPEKTKVGLYVANEDTSKTKNDSLLFTTKSLYFANVNDKSGEFEIFGISPGEYNLFAIVDENNNDLLEPSEAVAFYPQLISINDSSRIDSLELQVFPTQKNTIKIVDKEYVSRETYKITFSEALENIEIKALQQKPKDNIWLEKNRKDNLENIQIFHQLEDSIQVEVSNRVGELSLIIDTIWIKKDTSLYEQNILPKDNFQNKIKQAYFKDYELEFIIPAKSFDTDKVILEQEIDSTFQVVNLPSEIKNGNLTISNEWQSGENYKLTILPDGIKGINNTLLIDTLEQSFEIKGSDAYGTVFLMAGDSILQTGNYFYELIKSDKTIRKDRLKSYEIIELLDEGKYSLIIVKDDNDNQLWDTGNILERIQAEQTFVFKGIDVKANWDLSVKLQW